jgi:hypothetical protein
MELIRADVIWAVQFNAALAEYLDDQAAAYSLPVVLLPL